MNDETVLDIIGLKEKGYEIGEIADKLSIDVSVVREVLNGYKPPKTIQENVNELFDKANNIETTSQIKKINEEAWKLYNKAIDEGRITLASKILSDIIKQVELTSKKLGELNPKDDKKKNISPDFIEYLNDCLEEEGYIDNN